MVWDGTRSFASGAIESVLIFGFRRSRPEAVVPIPKNRPTAIGLGKKSRGPLDRCRKRT
jgi:hypothetical protein